MCARLPLDIKKSTLEQPATASFLESHSPSKSSTWYPPSAKVSLGVGVFLPASFQEANLFHVFRIHHADSLSRVCGFYWQHFENFQIMDENVGVRLITNPYNFFLLEEAPITDGSPLLRLLFDIFQHSQFSNFEVFSINITNF